MFPLPRAGFDTRSATAAQGPTQVQVSEYTSAATPSPLAWLSV